MLQNRSGVFEKYYNNSDYFPLPLHSKKTAGFFRQFSFMEVCKIFLFLNVLQYPERIFKTILNRNKSIVKRRLEFIS
jgi:hypothetical protein